MNTIKIQTPSTPTGWASLAMLIAQLAIQVLPVVLQIVDTLDSDPHTTIQVGK